MTAEDEALQELRNLAALIPCLMCRMKGGSNIDADGGCRHRSGMPIGEVLERYKYAVAQSANARQLAQSVEAFRALVNSDGLIPGELLIQGINGLSEDLEAFHATEWKR